MPSSFHGFICDVLDIVVNKKPMRVLDVGIGFGKWGYLFRDYCDVFRGRIYKNQWVSTIDGVEAFEKYIHPAHKYVYDNIFIGDISKICNSLDTYDFIFAGDVIEHLTKEVAVQTLETLKEKTSILCVIIPLGPKWKQGHLDKEGEDFEEHKSIWEPGEFMGWKSTLRVNPGGKPIGMFVWEK